MKTIKYLITAMIVCVASAYSQGFTVAELENGIICSDHNMKKLTDGVWEGNEAYDEDTLQVFSKMLYTPMDTVNGIVFVFEGIFPANSGPVHLGIAYRNGKNVIINMENNDIFSGKSKIESVTKDGDDVVVYYFSENPQRYPNNIYPGYSSVLKEIKFTIINNKPELVK